MVRKLSGNTLVIASHNPGKVREIGEMIAPFGIEAIPAASLDLPEPEETGKTFRENAAIKALACATASGKPALSDDSGLVVPALDGAPGIHSARWGGPKKDFSLAMKKVWEKLKDKADRRARFVCALALAWPDSHVEHFEGRVDGTLTWPPRGDRGFGYDPMFIADGHAITFGEMEPEKKHAISHRARAFRKFRDACLERG